MYLDNALILNSGSLSDLEISFEFNDNGTPKPTLIVGRNGAGKSNLLSFITDALIELAAQSFTDVAPLHGRGGHKWHRILGGSTIRTGSPYELALIKFSEGGAPLTYCSKVGEVTKKDLQDRLASFPAVKEWPKQGSHKHVQGGRQEIRRIFREGCFASFPASRAELPYWIHKDADNESSVFREKYENILGKPIVVSRTLPDIKPWLVDVIMDQMVDSVGLTRPNVPQVTQSIHDALRQYPALNNFNILLRQILSLPGARVVRAGRAEGNRKLQVIDGVQLLLPSLDSLSSGQATLLSIFSTVLRYADAGPVANNTQEMQGILLVDEVDAHLHADLQFEVLPRLIKLFPKIQFILTTHAPLFPLGMMREFEEQGFSLIELPEGAKISAERFSEFMRSFAFFKETKAFDQAVAHRVSRLQRPLVLCEGQTDPKYFMTAAQLLGFQRLADEVEFDWVGAMANGQAKDGGEGQLRQVRKTLQNNPVFVNAPTVLLFDCDVNDTSLDEGDLHVRVLENNQANSGCNKGVENLLTDAVFEDRFYEEKTYKDGPNETIKKQLNKVQLCDYLCDKKREAQDFEAFRKALEMLEQALWPEGGDG